MMRNNPADDPGEGVYHLKHEWAGAEQISYAVVTAVSALKGIPPTALPPLASVSDSDALDALFDGTYDGGHSTDYVRLTYAGCTVIIHRNGHVILQPPRRSMKPG